jgi:predicted nucleotidyltransferase
MISLKSKPLQKILNYYFLNPHARHYINELARLLSLDPKNSYIKLKQLEAEGVLQSEFLGQQRYFFLTKDPRLVKAYREFFLRTVGFEELLRKALKPVPLLEAAYLYGSYAKNAMDAGSDIDILAVGGHSNLVLQKAIHPIQKNSGREINVVNMSRKEFLEKKKGHNPFLANVFNGKIVKLL